MISMQQIQRAEKEFASAASRSFHVSRNAECALEAYTYKEVPHDPKRRERLLEESIEADYMAERNAFVRELIRKEMRALEMPINGELPAMPCDPGDTVVPGGIDR